MCGILGVISPHKNLINSNSLKTSIKSRGPDDFRMLQEKFGDKTIEIFFSRLSIIDLYKRSTQPFEKYSKILIFNGEIYNFLEKKFKYNFFLLNTVLVKKFLNYLLIITR